MDILGKLFGTPARVKIMRLFMLNPDQPFDAADIADRSKTPRASVRKEMNVLSSISFVKKRSFIKKADTPRKKSKRVSGWVLDPSFPYLRALEMILVRESGVDKKTLVSRFKAVGKIQFLAVAGVFTNDDKSRVDLLIVGTKVKKDALARLIASLESEIGKELSYALFDTGEFFYRLHMYDKLVMDVLEYPHERLIDHPDLSTIKVKMGE